MLSDFLAPPGEQVWWRLLARGFDVVPVLLQDPVWERSFPDVGGVPLPIARADGSGVRQVRVSRREAAALRAQHEERLETTLERMRALTLDPVAVGAHDAAAVHLELSRWSAGRAGRMR